MAKPKVLMINGFETTDVSQEVQDKMNALVDFYVVEQAPHDIMAERIADAVKAKGPFVGCITFLKWHQAWPWPLDEGLVSSLVSTGCRFFSSGGAGFDFVDVPYLTRNGAYYANTPTSASIRTADSACMMILQIIRSTSRRELEARAGKWQIPTYKGKDARKSTLGILGMGSIGKLVAKTMSSAFGMKIIYNNRSPLSEEEELEAGGGKTRAKYVSFDDLLTQCDVLSIHCPLTKDTRHLFNRDTFAKMKDGIILVNTSRGPVIHEEALVEALESGKVLRAALDVFEFEPEIHPRIVEMVDRTIIQPHCAVMNDTIIEDQQCEILANLEAFIKTESDRVLTDLTLPAMGKIVDSIPDHCIAQIKRQHMFWVATAPLDANGHVNLSPKGLEDTFHIIDKNTVWYEDLTGSGNETISHLRENGRITILFNMFEGPPGLIRLFGNGVVHEFGTAKYNELIPAEKRYAGSRCVIMIDVHKVGMSCGYQVPFYEFVGHRTRLLEWGAKLEKLDICADSESQRSDKGMRNYWATTNEKSIDGLPGMLTAMNAPDSFLDGERLGPFKRDNESAAVKTKARSCAVDVKNIWAFSLGVLATAAYVKLAL